MKNQKIGITCSCFDMLHAGHIKMLEEAKTQCNYLIAALQTDPTIDRPEKNKPIQSLVERYIQLMGCKFVDEIVPYQTEKELEEIFKSFKFLSDFPYRSASPRITPKMINTDAISQSERKFVVMASCPR